MALSPVNKKPKIEMLDIKSNPIYVGHKCSEIWNIDDFSKNTLENGKYVESLRFEIPGLKNNFFMRLFPKGRLVEPEDCVSLYVFTDGTLDQVVTCEFSIIRPTGESVNKKTFSTVVGCEGRGFHKFISRVDLLDQATELIPNDVLTVCCVLTVPLIEPSSPALEISDPTTPEDKTSGVFSLDFVHDWKNFFNQNIFSDVVLKVQDEVIHAHKIVLSCRSSVFRDMFITDRNIMLVVIPDITCTVFTALIRYMYFNDFEHGDAEFTLQLLIAAVKYVLPGLQKHCADRLCVDLSVGNVFKIFAVANAYHLEELLSKCMSLIECEVFSVTDWLPTLCESPDLLDVIKKHLTPKK